MRTNKAEAEMLKSKIESSSLENKDKANNIKLRTVLGYWSFGIISIWIILVAVVLFDNECLKLSENVIITMLVTTTANILGLPIIVLKNLFPTQ